MFQPIEITEITERPPTGVSSRPFRCLGEDGCAYYVKLGTALPDEKIAEWMFGFLASELGLPAPIGAIVLVDEELSRNAVLDTSEFGHGIGYGSREVAAAHDLTAPDAEGIETSLMAESLLFDWWILNEDRKLGRLGGNPNILISSEKEISLIDHGNAMDQSFDPDAFFEDHAFREIRDYWKQSDRREQWEKSVKAAIEKLPERWEVIPDEWLGNGSTIILPILLKSLNRVFDDPKTFWKPFEL